MRKSIFLLLPILLLLSSNIFSQTSVEKQYFQLRPNDLLNDISRSSYQDIELGSVHVSARFVPNSLMSEEVKRETPGIETYDLYDKQGVLFGNAVVSPDGVWLNYWEGSKMKSVIPDYDTEDPYDHYIDDGKDRIIEPCDYKEVMKNAPAQRQFDINNKSGYRGEKRNGDMKREYRIAIVCTGEFYELNGNTNSKVNAVIVSSVAGISAIYMRELAITFKIVKKKMYTNSATDPFDVNSPDNRTVIAAKVVHQNFGANTYDIGHALHRSVTNDGWDSGGVARFASVCRDNGSGPPAKAHGWSGSYNTSGYSWYSLFGHEIGHMFSAAHTFNGTGGSCTDNISDDFAYEIGSGITIMSYNGICGNNQNTPDNGEADNYFHIASLLSIVNHAEGVGSCAKLTPTNNKIPDVTANPCGATLIIPKSTPFYIKGDGMDEDGDQVYYSWEQFDEDGAGGHPTQGKIGSAASSGSNTPLFKCFPPSPDQYERYFPDLKTLAKGASSDKFQALSSKARVLHFKLVGRDFLTTGGAFGYDDLEVEVKGVGPLVLSTPPPNSSQAAGDMIEVAWDLNGSESLCAKAMIKLSINNGVSYNLILKEDVDYASGSTMVEIPAFLTTTSEARIMITCDDNDCASFFDIMNGNFNITSSCNITSSYICPSENLMFDQGDAGLDLSISSINGVVANTIIKKTSDLETKTTVHNVGGSNCKALGFISAGEKILSVSKTGTYRFNIDFDYKDGFGFISIFDNATFNNSNTCNSFIASSGSWGGMSSQVSASGRLEVELEACKIYKLLFYNYTKPNTRIESISGPGIVIFNNPVNPDIAYGYIAVNNTNNIMVAYNEDANFTTLNGGSFTIYGISYDISGPTPTDMNDYVGQEFFNYYEEGDCFKVCENPFNLEIAGTCKLEEAELGAATNCNPDDNSFTQSIILTYSENPATGDINVNGQSYTITTSPQTIDYIAQSNGENEAVNVFFTEEPSCILSVNFTQKENCCSFDIPFVTEKTICAGDEFTLDAGSGGDNGGSYAWSKNSASIAHSDRELIVMEAGIYTVLVTSATGCPRKATMEIIVSALPTLTVPTAFTFCENDVAEITITTDATSIKWKKDNVDILGETNKTIMTSEGGVYTAIVENMAGCIVTDVIELTRSAAPLVMLGDDRTACIGNEELFEAPTGTGYTYQWTQNGTNPSSDQSIKITDNTTLVLVVTDEHTCMGTDEVEISFVPGPTLTIDKTMIQFCEGEQEIVTATTNATSIKWLKDNVDIAGATNSTLTITESGVYTAHVEGISGCEVEKKAVVFVHPYPVIDMPSVATGCEGETVTIDVGTPAKTYQWKNSSGNVVSSTRTLDVTEPGIYEVEVTNEFDCTTTGNVTVEFTTRPSITLDGSLDICDGTTVQLTATSDGATYQWKKNGESINNETNKTLDITTPGVYTLVAYNGSNCFEEASTTVAIRTVPIVDLGSGHTICPGEQITLDASNTGSTYNWSTSETSQTIDVVHPDNLTMETILSLSVDVTNEFDCTTTGEVEVVLYPNINAQIDGDMGVCIGDTISLTGSGGQLFDWSGGNMVTNSGQTIMVFPTETTVYSVEVTDTKCSGQKETATFEVEVYSPGVVSGGPDKNVILGRDVELSGSGGESYIWSPDSTIVSGQGTSNPTVNPSVETTYYVTITDLNGCDQLDTVLVSIITDPLELLKHITIITPNDDGLNDRLEFIGLETFPNNTLEIYNRWGDNVFTASDYQKEGSLFDGTKNGKELPADTYFYILKFDEFVVKEHLTIIRPK